jgi:ribokinase
MTGPGRVVAIGAVNVDFVVAVDRLPRAGETVLGERLVVHGGGKGANAAVAAARVGAAVRLVAAVGDDSWGRDALAELDAEGIDTSEVAVCAGVPTGAALVVVDASGDNQVTVAVGANAGLGPEQVAASLAGSQSVGCVVVSAEVRAPAVVAAAAGAAGAGVPCVLDPAPVVPGLIDALAHGPILTPNEEEGRALASLLGLDPGGDGDAAPLARGLSEASGAPVVLTLGRGGALLAAPGDRTLRLAPLAVTALDSTGAGDTLAGVLAAWLAEGADLAGAARAAVAAAGLSVTAPGARRGMPNAEAVRVALGRS